MRWFRRLSRARRGFLSIFSGTLVAQIITLAFIPILSRVFESEDFGALTFVTAVSTLVTAIGTLRLETALMLPEGKSQVSAVLALALASLFVVSFLTGLGVYIWGAVDPELDTPLYAPLWVALAVVLSGLFVLLNRLALRKGGYSQVGKRAIYQAVGTGSGQFSFSFWPGGGLGLIFGFLVGRCVGIFPLYRYTREYFVPTDWKTRKQMLKRYWRFPVVFAPSSMLNSFGVQAPFIFVAAWFGAGFAGILGMADRIIGAPMTLIGNAVAQVFDAEIAKHIRQGKQNFFRPYLKLSAVLAVIASGVGLGFFLLGDIVVPLILGPGWELAGSCVQIMSVTIALRLIASPTSRVIGLFERSTGMVAIDLSRALLMIASMIWITYSSIDFLTSVAIMYYSLGFIYLITWFFGLSVVMQETKKRR